MSLGCWSRQRDRRVAGGVCTIERCDGLPAPLWPMVAAGVSDTARCRQLGPSLLRRSELPIRRPMIKVAVLDYAHRREGAAIEAATNRWAVLVDRAALRSQVNAGPISAPLEYQSAIAVPLGQEVGQVPLVALLINRDALIIAASRAAGARDRPGISAPPGGREVLWCAAHRSLSLVHCSLPPLEHPPDGQGGGAPTSAAALLRVSPFPDRARRIAQVRPTRTFPDEQPFELGGMDRSGAKIKQVERWAMGPLRGWKAEFARDFS